MVDTAITVSGHSAVPGLEPGFTGQILLPGAGGYDAARRVWNAMVDRRPAVIARCAGPADVAAAVRFARQRGLEIGVRGGGHSVLGLGVPDGGLMVDLSLMGAVRVDPGRRRAWVQGGALLGSLDNATQPFGLATTAGNVSHTGVGGLTLGGGMGWLARRFGLACDNVTRFEVVSAGGEILHASDSENPDLFWGLRGGGGNFGIVTGFEFRLHQVGTAALVAQLFYPSQDAAEAMRSWRDLIAGAPLPATLTASAGTAGDWPFLPGELHGKPVVSVGDVWIGDPDQGRALLPALRRKTPAAERVNALTYPEVQRSDDTPQGRHKRRYWKGHYLRQLSDDAVDAFVSRGALDDDGTDPALLAPGSLQAYGGAIASVGHGETAFSHRDTLVEFVARAGWTDPAHDPARIALARRYGAVIEPHASGVYVNDLTDESQAGVRRAYGASQMARLTALKGRYDPLNIFHLNHNIPPGSPQADG
jgi:FAD/FMN-containing dehydrogenase